MKIIIAGSRFIDNFQLICDAVKESRFNITEVISGCANGVDSLGEQWALQNNIQIKKFPADWTRFGKNAGPIRNQLMIDYVGKDGGLIIIWNGKSKGSANILKQAKGKEIQIYEKIINI